MISLAVFDMAGTTVNDRGAVYRALQQAVEETGVTVDAADLQTWMGTEKRAAITALIELGGGDPASPEGKVDAAFDRFQTILDELYTAEPPVAIDGVPEAIAELRGAGIKVALTTGFSRDVAEGILRELNWMVSPRDRDIEALDAAPAESPSGKGTPSCIIDALVCGDEVAMGRPAPFMIHRVMEETMTLDTARVLVAGDTFVDVQAGSLSGAGITIGVLTGELSRGAFDGQPATEILDSVAAIPNYLETLRA